MARTPQSHVLLISGPSGGGKSAWIRQLRDGTLPEEMSSLLPDSVATWDLIEANDFMKQDLDLTAMQEQLDQGKSFILHYDIVFIHTRGDHDYRNDPAMQFLDHATSIQSVWIRPEAEVLYRQFRQRSAQIQRKKSLGSRIWASCFRKPKRQLMAILKGQSKTSTSELYQKPDWIISCYQQWQKHLQTITQQHPRYSHLIIAPLPHTSSREGFTIVDQTHPQPAVVASVP